MHGNGDSPAPQHMRALEQANRVRLARAELKRQVAEGSSTVAEVVLDCPWEAESMAIADLLTSQHRWGKTRCRRFLAAVPMPETKTIGSMTERQRRALAARLAGDARGDAFVAGALGGARDVSSPAGRRRGAPAGGLRDATGGEAGAAGGDLDDVAVGVAQVDRAERAAVEHVGALHALAAQVVAPGLLLLGRVDDEREVVRRADADHALRAARGTA